MSMLAEPRRKKAWVLNPRKSEWADDESKFGQKMLEQMGWSKGKGLGKEMAGITEHIRPSVQNDSRGLGYEGRSDDWVAHLDDFNDLLASLQQGKKEATGGEGSTKSSVKSLEERSKKSRARVHYHKFTRGKDLSRYSSQDLASILGGRSEGAVASQPVTPVSSRPPSPPPHADSEPVSEAETETPPPPATEVDKSSGYTTISTGLSVKDYFAAKMRKMKMLKIKREQEQKDGSSDNEKPLGETATDDVNAMPQASETVEQEAVKSKKKKKKRAASPVEEAPPALAEEGDVVSEQPKKKRKKSAANVEVPETESAVSDESKMTASPAEQALQSVPEEEKASTSEKSKKKKKKSASNVEEVVPPAPEEESAVSEEPPKKKKKRKNAASSPEETSEAAADQSPQPDASPKENSAPAVDPSEESPTNETEKAASKKKKKRKKSKSKRNEDSD